MGGGDHAHIDLLRARGADGQHLALGQHAQQPRLQGERHVADLVEEEGAAVGLLDEPALALAGRAGEASRQMAEELALDQRLRNGGAVDGDERLAAALAGRV